MIDDLTSTMKGTESSPSSLPPSSETAVMLLRGIRSLLDEMRSEFNAKLDGVAESGREHLQAAKREIIEQFQQPLAATMTSIEGAIQQGVSQLAEATQRLDVARQEFEAAQPTIRQHGTAIGELQSGQRHLEARAERIEADVREGKRRTSSLEQRVSALEGRSGE